MKRITIKNPIADIVKRFTLGDSIFTIYEPNTRRGKPYLLEVKYPNPLDHSRFVYSDLGFFASIEAAEKKAHSLYKKSKNPYKSQAQRRKFHAMAERGEISQATVGKYDRESEGLDLPERVGNPSGNDNLNEQSFLAEASKYVYRLKGDKKQEYARIQMMHLADNGTLKGFIEEIRLPAHISVPINKKLFSIYRKHLSVNNPRKRQTMRERCEEMIYGKDQEPTFSYYRDVENPSFTKHGRKTFSIPIDNYSSWRKQLFDIANRSIYAGTPQLGFDTQKRLMYGTKQALTSIIKTLIKNERDGAKEIWGTWRDDVYTDDQRKQFYALESLVK